MGLQSTKRSGKNTLAYTGVEASTPPNLFTLDRAPTTKDDLKRGFYIGDLWIDRSTEPRDVWILVDLATAVYGVSSSIATWIKFGISTEGTSIYLTNNGTASSLLGYLNVLGDGLINTSSPGDNTINVNLTNGLAGQVLIGSDTGSPAWAYITSTSGSIAVTNLDNAIEIETTGAPALGTFTADDTNTATPAAGIIILSGSTNITTTGDGAHTVTVDLNDDVTIAGTLTLSAQTAGVLQTTATGEVFSSKGTDGQVLIGGGTGPQWANITVADTSMTVTNGPNTINLEVVPGYPTRPVEFLATQTTDAVGVLGGPETYRLGTSVALTEIFNVGNGLYPGNGVGAYAIFTAPLDGRYYLHMAVKFEVPLPPPPPFKRDPDIRIITTNKEYALISNEDVSYGAYYDKYKHISIIVEMLQGDTAIFQTMCDIANPGFITLTAKDLWNIQQTFIDGYYVG